MSEPECRKCGKPFPPDNPHGKVEYQHQPPEERPEIWHLCPGCEQELLEFLDE